MRSGRPATNQLEKSLAALTIGVHTAAKARERGLGDVHTGEYEQQVHVPLAGVATSSWNYTDSKVNWEMPFLYAPMQRRVPFEVPHFTHGVEFVAPTSTLVVIHAHVVGWAESKEGWLTGATVRFGIAAPMAGVNDQIPYSATAHLSFQGYATYAEGEEFA